MDEAYDLNYSDSEPDVEGPEPPEPELVAEAAQQEAAADAAEAADASEADEVDDPEEEEVIVDKESEGKMAMSGTINYTDKSQYVGELKLDLEHGKGVRHPLPDDYNAFGL